VLLLFLVSLLAGCSTTRCPPCVAEREVIEVKVPVPSCEPPPELPGLEYPDWPILPENPSEDQIKAFYAGLVATQKARERMCLDYVKSLEEILDGYRQ